MIELIATAESIEQGKKLIDLGVDKLIIGEQVFGLRIPGHFTFQQMKEMVDYAHAKGSQLVVAANAILHNDKIAKARDFLTKVKETGADLLTVGDTGLIQILKEQAYRMPYIYDASVLVTSPGQVNFWAKYGAVASMVAREVPLFELTQMADQVEIPILYQVYGATCIHQSKRNLLENYFSYIDREPSNFEDRHLFLSEPNKPDTHYSIYEDEHGTHIFANNDLNLLPYLSDLLSINVNHWYLDGIFCPGDHFVEVVRVFTEARQAIENEQWTEELMEELNNRLHQWHPRNREMDLGFFLHEPGTVK